MFSGLRWGCENAIVENDNIAQIIADNLIMLGGSGSQGGANRVDNSFAQPSMNSNEPVIDFGDSIEEDEIKVENIPF